MAFGDYRRRQPASSAAESWAGYRGGCKLLRGVTSLTYKIVDWLHAPGAREAHLRRDFAVHEGSRGFVRVLCDQLGENWADGRLRAALGRIARRLGQVRVEQLVEEARAIHAGSGMLVKDGSRRRTLGGVFFQLVKMEHQRRRQQPRAVVARRGARARSG